MSYLIGLVPVVATLAIALCLCFLPVSGGSMVRAKMLYEIHIFAFTMTPLIVVWLAVGLSHLRPQVWDFDLGTGQIMFNGFLVCPVEELQSIHMDRDYYSGDYSVLYLRTKTQKNIQMATEGIFGVLVREMQEAGLLISSHLGVALVLKDEYVPGGSRTDRSAGGSRRWGGKRQRRDPARRPRRGAV